MSKVSVASTVVQIDLTSDGIRHVKGGSSLHPTVLTWWRRKFRGVDTKIIEAVVTELNAVTVTERDVDYITVAGPKWVIDGIANEARRRSRERVAPRTGGCASA